MFLEMKIDPRRSAGAWHILSFLYEGRVLRASFLKAEFCYFEGPL